jgi:adenine-specific DNA-methyltransferase
MVATSLPLPFGDTSSQDARTLLRLEAEAARVAATSLRSAHRLRFARSYNTAVIAEYWKNVTAAELPENLVPPYDAQLDKRASAAARRLACAAARLDALDAAYALGTVYAGMLPPELRAELGAYYTPPALAERLLNQIERTGIDWSSCTVIDPACGGGSFLAPIARRMAMSLRRVSPDVAIRSICQRLTGAEIDPFAAWLSRVFVAVSIWPLSGRGANEVVLRVGDSLTTNFDATWELVVGNPPYGRVRLDPTQRRRFERSLYGHANLYGVFTDLALRLARPGGVIAYVTPTSFLGGEYFKKLRRLLAQEASPVAIDFVMAREGVFDGVLQETLLAVYQRGPLRRASVFLVNLVTPNALSVVRTGVFSPPRDPTEPWILPRTRGSAGLTRRLASMPDRLRDWGYKVSTGPLVWNRHKRQLRPIQEDGCIPLIWAEAVSLDGRFRFRAEKKNHAPFFKVEDGDSWLLVRQPCVLLQRTTAKEQQRRLIAAALPAQFLRESGPVTVENHLNMVKPITGSPKVAPEVLAAFLNTPAADAAFRCISGSVAVSAFELESLPLPPGEVVEALRCVLQRSSHDFAAECARLYGLT